jgi:hypothetical protein
MCRNCASNNQTKLGSEILVHFPGMKGIDTPAVLAFPKLVVCLDCGFTECTISEAELSLIRERGPRASAA